jgi:hypothetical protein
MSNVKKMEWGKVAICDYGKLKIPEIARGHKNKLGENPRGLTCELCDSINGIW